MTADKTMGGHPAHILVPHDATHVLGVPVTPGTKRWQRASARGKDEARCGQDTGF